VVSYIAEKRLSTGIQRQPFSVKGEISALLNIPLRQTGQAANLIFSVSNHAISI
jgi:hypothetical protein